MSDWGDGAAHSSKDAGRRVESVRTVETIQMRTISNSDLSTSPRVALSRAQLVQARVIAFIATPLIRAVCRTLTWTVEGQEHYDTLMRAGTPPILAFWHGRILPATWHFRNQGIVVITSQNFDGEWIARIIE